MAVSQWQSGRPASRQDTEENEPPGPHANTPERRVENSGKGSPSVATMTDYTPYQRKLIERYYERRDEIALTRLEEIVTELYLAKSDAQRKALWGRAAEGTPRRTGKGRSFPRAAVTGTVSRGE